MARTRRQFLLVLILPLLVGIGVKSLLDGFPGPARGAHRAPGALAGEPAGATELLEAQSLAALLEVPDPLEPARTPWAVSAEVLASGRNGSAAPEQLIPIPEPGSGLLLALGLAGLAARRR